MSKNNFGPQFRWEPHDNIKTGSSLIISSNSPSHSLPLSPSSSPRLKLDDLYNKAAQRRNTEDDLRRLQGRPANMAASDIPMREEKHLSPNMEKGGWGQRRGTPKEPLLKNRTSGKSNSKDSP